MADILKAMEMEKTYLSYRANGEEPFHFVDAVRECGFASLEEYFAAKREMEFAQLEFERLEAPPLECLTTVFRMMREQITGTLFVDADCTFVFNGTAKLNNAYCTERNIPILKLHTGAGTIVCTEGDFSLGVCIPQRLNKHSGYFLHGIRGILQKYTDKTVTVDKNDILVDGAKVLGSAAYCQNNTFMFVAHFSFSDKMDLIRSICIAEKVGKQVGYIDFMTRDALRREVSKWPVSF